jgi:4-hydroxybenzoate polyprenyltransferase
MITVFAGYTCIYALNDVTDYELDRQRMAELLKEPACFDLDCIFVRHPLAQGLIPFTSGVIWTFLWGLIALVYCRLYKVSQWKILIAATVKNLGALAAIFAVNPKPQPQLVIVVFIWIALWEVGGQNIPNDLVDMQEDGRLGAKTIPVVYGPSFSVTIIFAALIASSVLGLGLIFLSPLKMKGVYVAGAILSGLFFLLIPLRKFLSNDDTSKAINLFNQASLYPLGILTTTVFCILLQYI